MVVDDQNPRVRRLRIGHMWQAYRSPSDVTSTRSGAAV